MIFTFKSQAIQNHYGHNGCVMGKRGFLKDESGIKRKCSQVFCCLQVDVAAAFRLETNSHLSAIRVCFPGNIQRKGYRKKKSVAAFLGAFREEKSAV